jgi:hypothetical protein
MTTQSRFPVLTAPWILLSLLTVVRLRTKDSSRKVILAHCAKGGMSYATRSWDSVYGGAGRSIYFRRSGCGASCAAVLATRGMDAATSWVWNRLPAFRAQGLWPPSSRGLLPNWPRGRLSVRPSKWRSFRFERQPLQGTQGSSKDIRSKRMCCDIQAVGLIG